MIRLSFYEEEEKKLDIYRILPFQKNRKVKESEQIPELKKL